MAMARALFLQVLVPVSHYLHAPHSLHVLPAPVNPPHVLHHPHLVHTTHAYDPPSYPFHPLTFLQAYDDLQPSSHALLLSVSYPLFPASCALLHRGFL